jgi:predicted DsbA family dithiol-disulfide isomerase
LTAEEKKIDLYYVTDPMCSHCWAIEPTLRKFISTYEDYLQVHTVMGGLLEKWHDGPIDPANGIYEPKDVAPHWREVGEHSRMPIDGSVMVEDPVQSSYPASRVFKVIQKHHGDEKASEYLRRTREAGFAFNHNISKESVLTKIVNQLGLKGKDIVAEAESATGQELLNQDFAVRQSLGARGFPTVILVNEENEGVRIVGGRPFEYFEAGLKQVLGEEPQGKESPKLSTLLSKEGLLFSKEIEEMYDLEEVEVPAFLEKELEENKYDVKEVLGETYVVTK